MTRTRTIVVAVAVAAATGVAVVAAPAAFSDDPKAVLVASVVDPAEALPDDQREAAYDAQLEAHLQARNDWITAFESAARSVSVFERRELNVQYAAPPLTLSDALAAGERVVLADVTDLTFTPSGTVATLHVVDAVAPAGGATGDLRVVVGGGPEPDSSYGTGFLGIDPSMPFLFEGIRAFLVLVPADSGSPAPYAVQPFTGTYLVGTAGTVLPHDGNPFAASVDGLSVAAFRDLVRATA